MLVGSLYVPDDLICTVRSTNYCTGLASFVWSMTTLVLNRSLLNILEASSVYSTYGVYEISTRF